MSMWTHRDVPVILLAGAGLVTSALGLALVLLSRLAGEAVTSARWALAAAGMAAFLVAALLLGRTQRRVAAYQRLRNLRANAIRDQVLAGTNPARPYFVYLRPFQIDGAFVTAPRSEAGWAYVEEYGWPSASHDLESALALLVYPSADLVALSDEAGRAGAGYVRSSDETWRKEVRALCEHAEGIFVVPLDRPGTSWEVEMLLDKGWLQKCLFVMPAGPIIRMPFASKLTPDYRPLWEAGRARYPALRLPEYNPDGAVIHAGVRPRVFSGFGRSGRFRAGVRSGSGQAHALGELRTHLKELIARNDAAAGTGGIEPPGANVRETSAI